MQLAPGSPVIWPRICTWLCVCLSLVLLPGCSRTFKWDEEVQLNTGETLTVHREIVFEPRGGAGNPLDIAWRPRPQSEALEFDWRGTSFRFDKHGAPTVLVIASGRPTIIAPADAGAWDATHGYRCTVPFYVQFVPDATGRNWSWLARVEPALYGLSANLLQLLPSDRSPRAWTADAIRKQNETLLSQLPSRLRIDPAYTGDLCATPGRKSE